VIDTKAKLDHVKHLRVVVTAPVFDTLTISGTGELVTTGLAGDKLALGIQGTGKMRLAGKIGTVAVEIPGTGEIDAKDLVTRTTTIDVAGTGEATVHATSALDATISGTGAVTVFGNPGTVKQSITGTGAVRVK